LLREAVGIRVPGRVRRRPAARRRRTARGRRGGGHRAVVGHSGQRRPAWFPRRL